MAKVKLGILLSTPPTHPNLQTVIGIIEASLQQGINTYLYLVDDAVLSLDSPELERLSQKGLSLFLCAYGAQRRGISVSNKGIFSGLIVLSDLIKGCDRFIAFN